MGLAAGPAAVAGAAEGAPADEMAAPVTSSRPDLKEGTVARAAFKQGVADYDAGHFQQALIEFQTASALGLPEVHFDLAETHRALEQLPEAISEYEAFLAARPEGNPYAAQARGAIAELEGKVAHLDLATDPAAALVVDGQRRPLPGAGQALRLMPGAHLVEVSKPGRIPFLRSLELAAGERKRLEVTLAASDAAAPLQTSGAKRANDVTLSQPASPPRRPLYRSPWFVAGVGAALLGIIAASAWAMWPRHCETGGEVVGCVKP